LGVLLLLVGAATSLPRHAELSKDLTTMRAANRTLRSTNRELASEIEGLRREGSALEAAIRDELGWVRPGEAVVVFERR
jgi:cell division protein FtsB